MLLRLNLFSFLLLLAPVLSLSHAFGSQLELTPNPTPNSVVQVQGSFTGEDAANAILFLSYSKTGAQKRQKLFPIHNGMVSASFLLDEGPGTYRFDAHLCRNPNESCPLFKTFPIVRNADTRPSSELTFIRNDLFALDKAESFDSIVRLSGTLPPSRYLVLVARNLSSGTEEQYTLPEVTGTFERMIRFRLGPGRYELTFFACPAQGGSCQPISNGPLFFINRDGRDPKSYTLASDQIQSNDPAIMALAFELTRGTDTAGAIRAIHDWVTRNIAYDVEAYLTGNSVKMKWDAVTVLNRKLGICQGYSHLTAALLRAVGIPARVISGYAIHLSLPRDADTPAPSLPASCPADRTTARTNHAWNEVLVDGKWLPMDTTWNAGSTDLKARKFTFQPVDRYYLDPEVLAKDHLGCFVSEY